MTESGKRMPIDTTPSADGNLVLIGMGAHPVPAKWTGDRYKSHFATCPNAAQHRRKASKGAA
jgi:hypothetical protein